MKHELLPVAGLSLNGSWTRRNGNDVDGPSARNFRMISPPVAAVKPPCHGTVSAVAGATLGLSHRIPHTTAAHLRVAQPPFGTRCMPEMTAGS